MFHGFLIRYRKFLLRLTSLSLAACFARRGIIQQRRLQMKKISLLLVLVFCASLIGCSKDAEINAFISEFETATKEMVVKIDSNPTASGIDEAQKAFDARKATLKSKCDEIKDAKGFQVGADTKKKLEDSVTKNMQSLMDVSTKHMMELATDEGAMPKFGKLLKDYQATFGA
jgi:hypothetical protein